MTDHIRSKLTSKRFSQPRINRGIKKAIPKKEESLQEGQGIQERVRLDPVQAAEERILERIKKKPLFHMSTVLRAWIRRETQRNYGSIKSKMCDASGGFTSLIQWNHP